MNTGSQLPYLESPILHDFLDGSVFATLNKFGVIDHTKGSITDDFVIGIFQLNVLARPTILCCYWYNTQRVCISYERKEE